jgi:hypothetical protein
LRIDDFDTMEMRLLQYVHVRTWTRASSSESDDLLSDDLLSLPSDSDLAVFSTPKLAAGGVSFAACLIERRWVGVAGAAAGNFSVEESCFTMLVTASVATFSSSLSISGVRRKVTRGHTARRF